MSRRALAAALVVLVIAICAWPIAAFSMRHYVPEVDNDEVMYFLLVKVFRSQGFHGGYSFVNDRIPASPIHFDMHGPGTVLVYSALAPIVGWANYSPYLANVMLFAGSWLLLAFALRRRPLNQIAVAAFVLANGYFFMFLPSAMQESFHLSVAIAAAALWYLAAEEASTAAWVLLLGLLAMATLVRYAWVIVIPFVLFSFVMQQTSPRRGALRAAAIIASVALAAIASVAAIKLTLWWAVPAATAAAPGILGAPRIANGFAVERLLNNLDALVHFRMMRMMADYPKYFAITLLVTTAGFAAAAVRARRPRTQQAATYGFLLLAGSLGAQLLFYEVDGWKEFRVLAPMHALAGLTVFSRADLDVDTWTWDARNLVVGVVLCVIVVNGLFAREGVELRYWNNWTHQAAAIDESGRTAFAALGPHFELRPGASSFCKTAYGDSEVLADPRLIHLPDGFALSVLEPDGARLPALRGKYAIVKRATPATHSAFDWEAAFSSSSDWRKVAASQDLTLFRSTANCLS